MGCFFSFQPLRLATAAASSSQNRRDAPVASSLYREEAGVEADGEGVLRSFPRRLPLALFEATGTRRPVPAAAV